MLRAAVQAAYTGEPELFKERAVSLHGPGPRAHERSIVFHIARHLAAEAEALPPGWSVDVEYDLWHKEQAEAVKKRLYLHRSQRASKTGDQAAEPRDHDVYPDIIVHHRSGATVDHNLLVIEVKKEETSWHDDDRDKLEAFVSQLHYQHAAFLFLPRDGGFPEWDWIEATSAPHLRPGMAEASR
jgi:hypothetical protein